MVATDLHEEDLQLLVPPNTVKRLDEHEAVVVGGALCASRWHRATKRFAKRHTGELRVRPVFWQAGIQNTASTTSTSRRAA